MKNLLFVSWSIHQIFMLIYWCKSTMSWYWTSMYWIFNLTPSNQDKSFPCVTCSKLNRSSLFLFFVVHARSFTYNYRPALREHHTLSPQRSLESRKKNSISQYCSMCDRMMLVYIALHDLLVRFSSVLMRLRELNRLRFIWQKKGVQGNARGTFVYM